MISTWMEKLINMRKPRSAFLSIISFTFYFFAGDHAPAQNLWETNPLDIKHYSSNIAVHLNAVSEADQKISWVSEASRYVTLSDLLEVVSAMDDYSTAEKIGDFLQSHDQIFPNTDDNFFSIASGILWQSYFLGGGFPPQRVINQQVEYYKDIHPRLWFPSGRMRLKHLGRLIDSFIDAGDYQTSVVLLNSVYADMIREQNLGLDDVFQLHVRAFQIMVAQRKTTELRELFKEIARLDKEVSGTDTLTPFIWHLDYMPLLLLVSLGMRHH